MSESAHPRYVSREDWMCHIFDTRKRLMAHVVGIPYQAELEESPFPDRVDHVWITLQVPPCGTVLVSVNTQSRLNFLGGFDARVRVGIVSSKWTEKEEPFMEEHPGLDYRKIEKANKVAFEFQEHEPFAKFLLERSHAAIRVEAWGELYRRETLGMHQIHSRRASCAVPQDITGRDGALQFYLPDGTAELVLIKYCGQR